MSSVPAAPRIPTLDRVAGAFAARFPQAMCRLGNLETRVLADFIAAQRIERPVYVCGLARAGSTLLLEMLAQAPGFTTHRYSDYPLLWTPYWWNWMRARLPLPIQAPVERAHRDRIAVTRDSPEAFEEIFWMHFFPGRHDPGVDQVLGTKCDNEKFATFYTGHIRKLLAVRSTQRYLAKGNYNLSRLGYLQRLFPDARFVIAVREPVAHVASLVKQDQLFSAWSRTNPAIATQLARSGHFEFGPQKRAIHFGDAAQAASIQACFADERTVEAYARQWSAAYGWLASRLAEDAVLRRACLLVRYEVLCSAPAKTLAALHAHAGIDVKTAEELAHTQAPQVAAPDYYKVGLSAEDQAMIAALTNQAWLSLLKIE